MIHLGDKAGITATILGCGSSGGVPRLGGHWGACDANEPRNRRRRCSLLIEKGATNVLVDTSPDMRQQLLDAGCGHLDAVLYTHDHADQSHGIDDLRMIAYNMRKRVPVFMDAPTRALLTRRFDYCFERKDESYYPPILDAIDMPAPGDTFAIDGEGGTLSVTSFLQHHGEIKSLGFRFGPIAYSADVVGLPEESFEVLEGVTCWVVDCLRYEKHISHAHLDLTLSWLERVKPQLGILTNLHIDMDYQTLCKELPEGVIPAYDMLKIAF
ncbi:MAG: MBL fold metallo-hydrolase [Alphaproteobacteria bacterium]|nr:MAG: MBL fold metallo-hydrolase [Alphaproteobacteria bacterium]